jgi:ribosomal protein S27AE
VRLAQREDAAIMNGPPLGAVVFCAVVLLGLLVPVVITVRRALRSQRALRRCPRCGARAVRAAEHERISVIKTQVVQQCGQCASWRRVVVDDADSDVQVRRLARDRRRMRRSLRRLEVRHRQRR